MVKFIYWYEYQVKNRDKNRFSKTLSQGIENVIKDRDKLVITNEIWNYLV